MKRVLILGIDGFIGHHLTRAILSHHLDGAPLSTRQILIDLQKL